MVYLYSTLVCSCAGALELDIVPLLNLPLRHGHIQARLRFVLGFYCNCTECDKLEWERLDIGESALQ